MNQPIYDIFIIGGGINGVGIAADATTRGLTVCLAEQNDLASGTSSASTKLIHGGLRYLEHFEFSLVRKGLKERETLLKIAPHLIHPMQFIMPHQQQLRPLWLIRIGLFLYDHLTKQNRLPASKIIKFDKHNPLKPIYKKGFSYADCWVDDARLVIVNALQAKQHNASILPRHKVIEVQQTSNYWRVTLLDQTTMSHKQILSRTLVNATGPWINHVIENLHLLSLQRVRLIKGSHIILKKLYAEEHAYLLQNADGRVVFVIPYQNDFTLIGTTDVDYVGDPADVAISDNEIEYLCNTINQYFDHNITPQNVISHYSGVRAVKKNKNTEPKKASRDYHLELIHHNQLTLLNVFGGKLTTYRLLSEEAVDLITHHLRILNKSKSSTQLLPGTNKDYQTIASITVFLRQHYSFLPDNLIQRYALNYGMLTQEILLHVKSIKDMGKEIIPGLYEREIEYLITKEWARTSEDILWRRTKLGLIANEIDKTNLQLYLKNKL